MNLKVAVVACDAGAVERGVENLAWNLKMRLPFTTSVFSMAAAEWTTFVPFREFKQWEQFITFSKTIHLYRFLYQLEKINPYFDVFAERFFDAFSFSKNLLPKLDEFKPDVIVNLVGSTAGYFLRKYRKEHKTKFLTISGGGKNLSEIKNANTQPDIFTLPTPSAKRYFESKNLRVRIEMVPYAGGDPQLFSPLGEKFSEEEIKNLSKIENPIIEHPFVLSTSALEKYKRIDYLIQAMSKIKKGTLILTGDGSQRQKFIALGKKLLGQKFVYLGVLGKKEIHKIYNTCDIFCLPNIGEYFGCVLVEALLSGLPIVCNDDDDKKFIVSEKCGVLTDVRNVDNISNAIQKADKMDWKGEPRKQGEKFSWDIIMKQYEKLILELAQEQ